MVGTFIMINVNTMKLNLSFDLSFKDLQSYKGLVKLDGIFLTFLKSQNEGLYQDLLSYRSGEMLDEKLRTFFLIESAKYLESFLYELFGIKADCNQYENERLIANCHRHFVQRIALRKYKSADEVGAFNIDEFKARFDSNNFILQFARDTQTKDKNDLADYEKYAALAYYDHADTHFMFHLPRKYDGEKYLYFTYDENNQIYERNTKQRLGFSLTDQGEKIDYIIDQANYCIYCHNQSKDSCSKGIKDTKGEFKKSSGEINLTGCPLEEKISEMNFLKYNGNNLAAFAIAVMDNPMIAATGHRICNDCMKSCIYQKQEPVNIPQIETNILKEVINLPWGFEIYNLLTLWNPLQEKDYLPSEETGNKVMVVGLGPAGFTLCHYLTKLGHEVVAVDGLKIEPLDIEFLEPIYQIEDHFEDLSERYAGGFGGVMEYGITNRWNKNYLKILRIILMRRKNLQILGGVRFGSNITPSQAKEMGFDHVAICSGAGKPHLLDIKNGFSKGVRSASDFLMSLQLTGSANKNSISNLQIRMPILVIGGGLTAIDTATEALAYYPIQVLKFLDRYELLGDQLVLDEEEKQVSDEFILHGKLVREEMKKPGPNLISLLNKFGGVKILYRRSIEVSPAYRSNHEEVEQALSEGIKFIEYITPQQVMLDEFSHIKSVVARYKDEHEIEFPAKTLLIAAGTSPNLMLASEYSEFFNKDGKYFKLIDDGGNKVAAERNSKPNNKYCLTYKDSDEFSISFLGDAHPSYAGNVVKAMASAKNSYKIIAGHMKKSKAQDSILDLAKARLSAHIVEVNMLTNKIVELVIHCPQAAINFKPGQFFKLQNFRKNQVREELLMEPLAMTGASVDQEKGLISLIILEMGGSSSLCRYLKKGEEVVLMGPTGTPTEIMPNQNVLLLGGGLGNAVLFSIGKAIRATGGKVIYFAGYRSAADIFKKEEIEKTADIVIWCSENDLIPAAKDHHYSYQGNIVQALEYYSDFFDDEFRKLDKVIVIGSDKMMAAVNNSVIKNSRKFSQTCEFISSINSPMQCMMKEICGQCIQRQIDPETGLESYIYSCVNQDQKMKCVDFEHLAGRLKNNSLSEKMTAAWIEYLINNK